MGNTLVGLFQFKTLNKKDAPRVNFFLMGHGGASRKSPNDIARETLSRRLSRLTPGRVKKKRRNRGGIGHAKADHLYSGSWNFTEINSHAEAKVHTVKFQQRKIVLIHMANITNPMACFKDGRWFV